ncbi:MAG: hypothetical protein NVS4B8_24220 [Herpetosiphon sp.]
MIRRMLLPILALLALFAQPALAASLDARRCFPGTPGITDCIAGRFLEFWTTGGGLEVFGYPITDQHAEARGEASVSYVTQWFERNRFERHPEQVAPYDVLLGRLGAELLLKHGRDWRTEEQVGTNPLRAPCRQFTVAPAITREVCGAFLVYWLGHGLQDARLDRYGTSLALFGLPLTGVRQETNPNGDAVLTQWFERARFEWHPAQADPYKVQLGLLGTEAHRLQVGADATAGIEGEVLVGPTCPVEVQSRQCAPRPLAATIVVADQATAREVMRFASQADGHFHVALAPGSYLLIPQMLPDRALPRPPGPITILVLPNQYARVTIVYDSGLRCALACPPRETP